MVDILAENLPWGGISELFFKTQGKEYGAKISHILTGKNGSKCFNYFHQVSTIFYQKFTIYTKFLLKNAVKPSETQKKCREKQSMKIVNRQDFLQVFQGS